MAICYSVASHTSSHETFERSTALKPISLFHSPLIQDILTRERARNETTPTCTGNQDGTDCCTNQESWETCFLRLSTGLGDFRYDERSGNFCNQSIINVRPDLESPARDQARYVNGAICYMHSFFASFYDSELLPLELLFTSGLW